MEASDATDNHSEIGGQRQPTNYKPRRKSIALVIPKGNVFVVTDISIQRETVVGTVGLFNVSLEQNTATASELRWAFVGSSAQNIERSFTTGIAFSTAFVVQNGVQLGDAVVVRLWGFLQG
jgi:hypothetical protein